MNNSMNFVHFLYEKSGLFGSIGLNWDTFGQIINNFWNSDGLKKKFRQLMKESKNFCVDTWIFENRHQVLQHFMI